MNSNFSNMQSHFRFVCQDVEKHKSTTILIFNILTAATFCIRESVHVALLSLTCTMRQTYWLVYMTSMYCVSGITWMKPKWKFAECILVNFQARLCVKCSSFIRSLADCNMWSLDHSLSSSCSNYWSGLGSGG